MVEDQRRCTPAPPRHYWEVKITKLAMNILHVLDSVTHDRSSNSLFFSQVVRSFRNVLPDTVNGNSLWK